MPYTEENGLTKAVRQSEISAELEVLHASINTLGEVAEMLTARIEPVLSGEVPIESVNEKRSEANTKVGENIRAASDRINSIRAALERVTRRVEI
jgi:prefoldin subunit 5